MRISDWSSDVCSSDLGPGLSTRIRSPAIPRGPGCFSAAFRLCRFPRWSHRLVVTTPPFHGGDPGSNPGGITSVCSRCSRYDHTVGIGHLADGCELRLEFPIGRASCREGVCQYVSISVVAVTLTHKNKKK